VNRHVPVRAQWAILSGKLRGHYQSYGSRAIATPCRASIRGWCGPGGSGSTGGVSACACTGARSWPSFAAIPSRGLSCCLCPPESCKACCSEEPGAGNPHAGCRGGAPGNPALYPTSYDSWRAKARVVPALQGLRILAGDIVSETASRPGRLDDLRSPCRSTSPRAARGFRWEWRRE